MICPETEQSIVNRMQQDGSVRAHTTHRRRESQSCQGHPFQLPTPYILITSLRGLRLSGVVVITPVLHTGDRRFEPGLNQVESEIICVSFAVSFHE